MRHLLLFASLVGGIFHQGGFAADTRPNIVFFISDDHSQLDSTAYGAKDVRTPNMQRLADGGVVFNNAFVASPSCAPSRAALLTGLMPARNGAEANHSYKRTGIRSLPETLRDLGYSTAAFGKVAHGRDAPCHGFDKIEPGIGVDLIAKYLDERDASMPVCLCVGTHHPHVPWPEKSGYDPANVTLPPTFVDTPETREFRARYYTAITLADDELGRTVDLVKQKLGPDTIIIYSADHGAQWPFGKWNLYDSSIRIPLVVSWPGVIKPGSRTDALVQWTDVFPTLIELAGGNVPAGIDGRSFANVLRGKTDAHRTEIFTTHSGDGGMNVYPIRALRRDGFKFIMNLHPEFAYTTHIDKARDDDGLGYWRSWHGVAQSGESHAAETVKRYHERPAMELYDLKADPSEQHNLAADPAQSARLGMMCADLEKWMQQQGDQRTVFNTPRLLSDPASTRPAEPGDLVKRRMPQKEN